MEVNIMNGISSEEDKKYSKYGEWIVIGGTLYIIYILFLLLYKKGIL